MRQKKVWRYYCDYCKKSNCSKHSMRLHEEHCTMNPKRKCRMCDAIREKPQPINKLLAMLPDPVMGVDIVEKTIELPHNETWKTIIDNGFDKKLKESISDLREATNGCPACMMAAVRQKGYSKLYSYCFPFDYKEEVKEFWREVNDTNGKYDLNMYL